MTARLQLGWIEPEPEVVEETEGEQGDEASDDATATPDAEA